MKSKCIILWTDFCQGPLPTVGADIIYLTNVGYRYIVIMPVVRVGVENYIFWMYEVKF
jgi:hypothetical protein